MVNSELIVDFVNTREEGLASWFATRGLARVPADEFRRAEEVREALRALLLANNEVDVDGAAAAAVLEAAARRARLEPEFTEGRLVARARGVPGVVGAVLAEVHAAMADGSWPRLKACRARDCEFAFVDNAKNRSRAWCSMQSCGNREKVRSYRERHRSHP
jgi:predicted RNA-binding Zn ribbon-like protein